MWEVTGDDLLAGHVHAVADIGLGAEQVLQDVGDHGRTAAVEIGVNGIFSPGDHFFEDETRRVQNFGGIQLLWMVQLALQFLKDSGPIFALVDHMHAQAEKAHGRLEHEGETDLIKIQIQYLFGAQLLKAEVGINIAKQFPEFQLVLENAQRLKDNRDDKVYSLNYDKFNTKVDNRDKQAEKFKNLWKDPVEGLGALNLTADFDFIQADSSRIARNDVWIKDMSKDIYLDEAINVMSDMIKSSPSLGSVEKK